MNRTEELKNEKRKSDRTPEKIKSFSAGDGGTAIDGAGACVDLRADDCNLFARRNGGGSGCNGGAAYSPAWPVSHFHKKYLHLQ